MMLFVALLTFSGIKCLSCAKRFRKRIGPSPYCSNKWSSTLSRVSTRLMMPISQRKKTEPKDLVMNGITSLFLELAIFKKSNNKKLKNCLWLYMFCRLRCSFAVILHFVRARMQFLCSLVTSFS